MNKATPKTPAPKKAWNAGKTFKQHSVKVGSTVYPSTWKAFLALGLAKGKEYGPCVKFRAALKKLGVGKSLPFPVEGKKPVLFTLVEKGTA